MAGDTTGKRKLPEQSLHALAILANVGIDLTIGPLQVGVGHQPWTTVTWTGNINDIQIMGLDEAVEVYVNKVEPR